MFKLLSIGLGGFLGSIARYGLSGLIHRLFGDSFPLGTMTVNVLGCLLIGGIMYLVDDRQFFSPNIRLFLLVGLLGSFTTFSTMGYETFEFLRQGDLRFALLYVCGNLVLGLGAVLAGWTGARFCAA